MRASREAAPLAQPGTAPRAPAAILRSPGQALDRATRAVLEPGLAQHFRRRVFQSAQNDSAAEREAESAGRAASGFVPNDRGPRYDFSRVRLHADAEAAASARSLRTSAYAVGRHVVLDPAHSSRRLLAHELTHVLQQGAGGRGALQCDSPEPKITAPPAPRRDYIFIMGQDPPGSGNPYYKAAIRFYRAHAPEAVLVTDLRNLTDLLSYVVTNISAPIGNLSIVSHANEDGTVAFGLNAKDKDQKLSVPELRAALHPEDGGASKLPGVTTQIDGKTRIHLKGCDLGRTQEVVELFDEAFGGAGAVNAPTHEQDYGDDPALAKAEEKRVREAKLAELNETLAPIPEQPAALDPSLKGADRAAAQKERNTAVAARQAAIKDRDAQIKAAKPAIEVEAKAAGELAGTYESFGGAMFQRPGTKLYTADELKPEVAKSYGQLDEKQQAALVGRLVKAEKVITVRPASSQPYPEPRTVNEANIIYGADFRAEHFTPKKVLPAMIDESDLTIIFEGRVAPPGEKPHDDSRVRASGYPTDETILAAAKKASPNPERYNWWIERTHDFRGNSKGTAVGQRVMAYDHHGSLDPAVHEHFLRPESDKQYYANSTFAPAPPPDKKTAGAAP